MNQNPSRQPAFVTIACLALLSAWGTGAYEAETGASLAVPLQDAAPLRVLASECPDPRGAARAVCVFETSRRTGVEVGDPRPLPQPTAQATARSGLTVASHKDSVTPSSP